MSETTRQINPLKFVWLDAYEAGGEWYTTDYVPEDRLMITYGYPIAITREYVSIASTYDQDDDNYAVVINIPIGMLKEVTSLSAGDPQQASTTQRTPRQTILENLLPQD